MPQQISIGLCLMQNGCNKNHTQISTKTHMFCLATAACRSLLDPSGKLLCTLRTVCSIYGYIWCTLMTIWESHSYFHHPHFHSCSLVPGDIPASSKDAAALVNSTVSHLAEAAHTSERCMCTAILNIDLCILHW